MMSLFYVLLHYIEEQQHSNKLTTYSGGVDLGLMSVITSEGSLVTGESCRCIF